MTFEVYYNVNHTEDWNRTRGYYDPKSSKGTESAILIVVGSVGMVGNLAIVITILLLQDLRKTSSAFLFHHCFLDFIKAAYCLPFAYSIMTESSPSMCNILGGSFIIFVTTSAFNLLAMVMNEAYQFADLNVGIKDSGNFCCVTFGIFMIWFTSLILNLGVAFIPGNPSFVEKVGHCIFLYGEIKNYVLHILWIVLVSFAIGLTVMYLRKLHRDIRMNSYYRLSTLIRATVTIDPHGSPTQSPDQQAEKILIKKIERYSLRKVYILMTMTLLFVLFWYPLFMLTVVDPGYLASPYGYRVLTMFACSNAALSPFFFVCLIKKNCCCRNDYPEMGNEHESPRISMEPLPRHQNRRMMVNERNSGIYNEFFSRSVESQGEGSQETERMTQQHTSSDSGGECSTTVYHTQPRYKGKRTQKTPNNLWMPAPTL